MARRPGRRPGHPRQKTTEPTRRDRAANVGRALWWAEVGNLIGTVAALAWSHQAFIIGAIISAIFAVAGSKTHRNKQ